MLEPDMIPDEVFEAFQKAWAVTSTLSTKECLAAALNAWPSAAVCHYTIADNEGYEMVLPLPFPKDAGDETIP